MRTYTLKDIYRLLRNIPPAFILILYALSLIISNVILQRQQDASIALLDQKFTLEQNFAKEKQLEDFVASLQNSIDTKLEETKNTLQMSVHNLTGKYEALATKPLSANLEELMPFIRQMQRDLPVDIVVFDPRSLDIIYGKSTLESIQELIFSQKNDPNLLRITQLYIFSQGNHASFTWKDDITKTIQLSYFDHTPDGKYLIGSFSLTDSLKRLHVDLFSQAMQSNKNENIFHWLYDHERKTLFNGKNEQRWSIDTTLPQSQAVIYMQKYFLSVGLISTKEDRSSLRQQKQSIIQDFRTKWHQLAALISFVTLILVTFIIFFSSFIKRIFDKYNKQLHNKNRQLTSLKERYELAVIASNDGLWDTDFETNKTFFSKKWLHMLGYKTGEISSYEQWFELLHKDDRSVIDQAFWEHVHNPSKDHLVCEYRLRMKNGKYKWVLGRGKIFKNENLKPKRLLMMTMDIDERKRTAKNLKDTQMLISEGDIVFMRLKNSADLEIVFISQSIQSYGFEAGTLQKQHYPFSKLIHPDDLDRFMASLKGHLKQNIDHFAHSYRLRGRDGLTYWVVSHMMSIKDDIGNVTHLYGYLHDITALKKNERELQELVQEELEKNREKDRLLIQQNKLASMGEMIGAIAHQWRQPLNNIGLIMHFIKDNITLLAQDESQKEHYFARTRAQIEYMSQTIDDFRNFYKPSKHRSEFDVKVAISAAVAILNTSLEKESISVQMQGDGFSIDGYENEFKQAILNILTNARDVLKVSQKNEKRILITYTCSAKSGTVTIENNGGRASKEVLDRMFEPYFTTKFEDKGTGIGLYMTQTIIEKNMQGKITAQNTKEGVCFSLTFPL